MLDAGVPTDAIDERPHGTLDEHVAAGRLVEERRSGSTIFYRATDDIVLTGGGALAFMWFGQGMSLHHHLPAEVDEW